MLIESLRYPTRLSYHVNSRAGKKRAYDVLVLDQPIDQHCISLLEQKLDKVTLKGVDADPIGQLIDKND